MVLAYYSVLTEIFMRDNGFKTKRTDRVSFMAKLLTNIIKVNSKMESLKALEF
jgi:hypothetical protein